MAAKKEKKKSGPSDKKSTPAGWLSKLRYGETISLEFFKTNAWLMIVIVVTVLALIGLRYKTKTKMAEIKQLTADLQRAESHKLHEKALYMSLIRETEMKRMVKEKNLDLHFQEQPPYELTAD